MVFLFSIQLVLSIVATAFLIADVDDASDRVNHVLSQYNDLVPEDSMSPIPPGIEKAYWLMEATLCINLVFWLWVARLVHRCTNKVLAIRAA
jgi:hypothetical protein